MWKWLCSSVIVASAIVSVAYEQHYAREKYQAQAQADCVVLAVSIDEKHSCIKEALGRKDYAPWWYILVTWPDGITPWAIIATGFVIAWQSSETRKAAKAALKQADHMVASERAWVTVEIFQEDADPSDMRVWEKGSNYGLGVPVRLKNIGKTPARIIESYARCELVTNADPNELPFTPVLPAEPDYTTDSEQNRIMAKRRMLMPEQTYDHLITLPPLFFEQYLQQYKISERLLCVYGCVRYETFGEERETNFCYAYMFCHPLGTLTNHKTGKPLFLPAYRVTGPEIYNNVT